jgi:hypothetical protein
MPKLAVLQIEVASLAKDGYRTLALECRVFL